MMKSLGFRYTGCPRRQIVQLPYRSLSSLVKFMSSVHPPA